AGQGHARGVGKRRHEPHGTGVGTPSPQMGTVGRLAGGGSPPAGGCLVREGVSCGWMSPAGGSTRISHEISKWIHPQGTREAVALTSVIVADDPEGIHLRVLRAADIARRGLGGHAEEVDDL